MNEQLANAFRITLTRRAEKDAEKFRMFFEEVGRKQAELVGEVLGGNPNAIRTITLFLTEAFNLTTTYINRAAQVGKNPWKYLFSDPFRGERELVRQFARRWDMSPAFRELLG